MNKLLTTAFLVLFILSCQLQAAVRIATYNINGGVVRTSLDTVLNAMGQETVEGISGPVDMLFLQEQNPDDQVETTQTIADHMNSLFSTDVYVAGTIQPNGISSGGSPGVVYNSEVVELLDEEGLSSPGPRSPVRYTFRLVGYSSPDAVFYIYCCHLKAGSSETTLRASEVASIRQNADSLGADKNVIFLGDFNLYNSGEGAWTNFTASGNAKANDPVNKVGYWHDRYAYKLWHTQSPRSSSSGALVGGGMDDRFDFQLISNEVADSDGFAYIEDTYHGFGNDGTHNLNGAITTGSTAVYSATVRSALATASDHIPVVAEYQVPAIMDVAVGQIPTPQVICPGYTLPVDVSNDVDVDNTCEADELEYTIEVSTGAAAEWTTELPDGWNAVEIGSVASGSNSAYKSDTSGFMIEGVGNISSTADNFYYVYKNFSGDGEFYYRLDSIAGDNTDAVAGIMLREDLTTNCPFALLQMTEGQEIAFRRRYYQYGVAMSTSYTAASTPKWLKLTRSGTSVTAYTSDDGNSWTSFYSDTMSSLSTDIYIGFAVATYDSTFSTAYFSLSLSSGSGGTVYTDLADQTPAEHDVELLAEQEGDTTVTLEVTGISQATENAEYQEVLSYSVTFYDDFDGDYDFDIDDINLFLANMGTTTSLYDLDESGLVDSADRDILIHDIMAVYYGDTDLDRDVDLVDLVTIIQNYLVPGSGSQWQHGDMNGDGFVDMNDFGLLSRDWMN